MNSTSGNVSADYFNGLFEPRPSKVLFMSLSFILMLVSTVMCYSVVWYERYGIDAKQTILNKLFSLLCWTGIEFIILVNLPSWVRCLYGPMPASICWLQLMSRNWLMTKILLLRTGMVLARYACIFWIKNPSAFCDEFWKQFINIWVYIVSIVPHLVHYCLHVDLPVGYFICTGEKPLKYPKSITKYNASYYVFVYASLAVHLILSIKIYFYKNNVESSSSTFSPRKLLLKVFEKHTMSDFTTITCGLISAVAFGFLIVIFVRTEPQDFNRYPGTNSIKHLCKSLPNTTNKF